MFTCWPQRIDHGFPDLPSDRRRPRYGPPRLAVSSSRRLLIAALVAPSAPVLMVVFGRLFPVARTDPREWNDASLLLDVLIGLYACAIVVGIPAYIFVRRKRLTSWSAYIAVAIVAGVTALPIGFSGLLAWALLERGPAGFVRAAGILATLQWKLVPGSILGGLLFIPIGWLFWRIERNYGGSLLFSPFANANVRAEIDLAAA